MMTRVWHKLSNRCQFHLGMCYFWSFYEVMSLGVIVQKGCDLTVCSSSYHMIVLAINNAGVIIAKTLKIFKY